MIRKYRVAVIGGAGTWGRHYLHAYARHPDCEVVGLVDRSSDRRQRFADQYGIEKVYDCLEALLAEDLPDIVSAVIPVESNPETVIACAEAGVRVVSCEKPMAVTLSDADEMVRICRERGTVFSCGSLYADVPGLSEALNRVRAGFLGRITGAVIPGGLPREMAGAGCVPLTLLRLLTQQEIVWTEGWTLPPEPGWTPPPGVLEDEMDCGGYGLVGLSGGVVCEISKPRPDGKIEGMITVTGETGTISLGATGPVFDPRPEGASDTPGSDDFFTIRIERLLRAWDSGKDELDSGRGYHQTLETAIALKQSTRNTHTRIHLPLKDRSLRLFPHPYRLQGGDAAGWKSFGYTGPPDLPDHA